VLRHDMHKALDLGILYPLGKKTFLDMKDMFIKHFETEEKDLYSKLKNNTDEKTCKICEEFIKDSHKLKEEADAFFNKYETDDSIFGFAVDLTELIEKFNKRISLEEQVLFHVFTDLENKSEK